MNILNKYLFRTIREKFFRQSLMLLAIIISTSLLIVTLSVGDLLTNLFLEQAVEEYGDYNVKLKMSNESIWMLNQVDELKDVKKLSLLESAGYVVEDSKKEFMVLGVDYDELKEYTSLKAIETNFTEFKDKEVLLSTKVADNLKCKINDKIKLFIDGQEQTYTIKGIYENEGLFKYDGEERFSIIIPKENLAAYNKDDDCCTTVLACIDKNSVADFSKQVSENHNLVCTQNYDEKVIRGQFEWIQAPLIFMLFITLIMSAFIISCTFKVIVNERLPIIGTFFSQGATYRQVNRLLLKEGSFYGMLGGVIGGGGGYYLTQLTSNYSIYSFEFSKYQKYSLDAKYYLIGFVFAIALSMITVLFTVRPIKKMQLKEVILNQISTIQSNHRTKLIIAVICLVIAIIMNLIDKKLSYILSIPSVCMFMLGAVLLVSYVIKVLCERISKCFRGRNTVLMLVFKNIATTTILKSNITLITVCFIAITIVSSMSATVTDAITGSYGLMNFNMCANINISKSEEFGKVVRSEFKDSPIYEVGSIVSYLNNDTLKQINMYYVNTDNYAGFDDYMEFEDKENQLKELERVDNGIIISKRMAKTYGIKQNEVIKLTINDSEYEMKVTSIVDCKMYASGNYNIISKETAKTMFSYDYPSQYYIKTNLSKENVKEKLKGYGAEIVDKDDLMKDAENSMKQFTDTLSMFAYIMMIMACFGIISNMVICFVQRKKEIAVFTSLGMNNGKKVVLHCLEAVFMTLFGIILGICIGGLLLILIGHVFKFLMLALTLRYNVEILLLVSVLTMILVLTMFIPLIIKLLKIDVIKELKFE